MCGPLFNVLPWSRHWHTFWLSKSFGLDIAEKTEVAVGLSLKTSVTDDVIDWPLPNKIIDSTTAR